MNGWQKNLFFYTFLPAAAFALMACSSSGKLPCETTDWYELGRRHGARGAPESDTKNLKISCSNEEEKFDALALYESGRSLGLAEYCTEANGLEMGRLGETYNDVCPDVLEEAFLAGFQRGQNLAAADEAVRKISTRLTELDKKLRQPGLSLARRGLLEGQKLQLLEKQKTLETDLASAKSIQNRSRQ